MQRGPLAAPAPTALAALLCICFFFAPSAAAADNPAVEPTPPPPPPPRVELRHGLRVDIPITMGLATGLIVWTAVKYDVLGNHCTWCEPASKTNAVDDFFRTALRRPDPKPAATLSNVLSYGVGPVMTIGLGVLAAADAHRLDDTSVDLLLAAEGALAAVAVSETLKPFIRRERPDFHALTADERRSVPASKEPVLSFPSGHPMAVFAVTASMGTVASMRNYRLAPLIWVAGSIVGVATGYLRIAADRHYFTDVLGGAAIGYGIGAGVPWLFHGPVPASRDTVSFLRRTRITTTQVPGGRLISVGSAF